MNEETPMTDDDVMIPSATPVSAMQVHIPRLAREHYETREYLIKLQAEVLKLVGVVDELIQTMDPNPTAEPKPSGKKNK
jgi:hypothetical protein